jgi:hypothetical protein
MRGLRNVIHIGLILALLAAGMPLYQAGDANRDERVDLADAILRVQGVAAIAEQPALFFDRMEDALITLSAVAGFETLLKTDRSVSATPVFSGEPYLIPDFERPVPRTEAAAIGSGAWSYRSMTVAPDSPPPRSL